MEKSLNWALAGTGGISNRFIIGLKAAGGKPLAVVSRTMQNARGFANRHGVEKACDNYDQMLEDKSIDIVYIGTPNNTHRDMTIKALKAKKAVLCEKPSALNSAELREMISTARENNCFFMEAMWNRFTPPLCKVREWLAQSLIGEIKIVQANFGFNSPFNPAGRVYNPELGGGSLLDAGIYPLALISMVFGGIRPGSVKSQLYLGSTGVDEEAFVILSYGGPRMAFYASAINTQMINDAWIYGTSGKIHVPAFTWAHSADLILDNRYNYHYEPEYISNGYGYEAVEVMNCIRAGKTESPVMSWNESLVLMETMDEVRRQSNFVYPGEIKTK
ncbi:MAG: Gfo/Idh/MocA family oxidoreductase [Treponema sp.]|nr:Gfo/Idh/MocA family oxidoreductase [Treponema sp.]